MIDGRRGSRRQADAEGAEHQRVQGHHAGNRQQHAHHRREDDERDDLELAQGDEIAPVRAGPFCDGDHGGIRWT